MMINQVSRKTAFEHIRTIAGVLYACQILVMPIFHFHWHDTDAGDDLSLVKACSCLSNTAEIVECSGHCSNHQSEDSRQSNRHDDQTCTICHGIQLSSVLNRQNLIDDIPIEVKAEYFESQCISASIPKSSEHSRAPPKISPAELSGSTANA